MHSFCFINISGNDPSGEEIKKQRKHIKIFNQLYSLYLYMISYKDGILNFNLEYEKFIRRSSPQQRQQIISNMDAEIRKIEAHKVDDYTKHPELFDDFYLLNIPIKNIQHGSRWLFIINGDTINIDPKKGVTPATRINQLYFDELEMPNKHDDEDQILPPSSLMLYTKINDTTYRKLIKEIREISGVEHIPDRRLSAAAEIHKKYLKYKHKYLSLLNHQNKTLP